MINYIIITIILFSNMTSLRSDIYEGRSKGFTCYYVPCKNGKVIVEIIGIKYAQLDSLQIFESKNDDSKRVISAKNNHSVLTFSNNNYTYKNKVLGVDIILKPKLYNQKLEKNRFKIFEINYMQKIGWDKVNKQSYEDCLKEFEKYKNCN